MFTQECYMLTDLPMLKLLLPPSILKIISIQGVLEV